MGRPRQRFQSACGDAPSDAFLAGAIQSAARSGRRGDERNSAVAFVPGSLRVVSEARVSKLLTRARCVCALSIQQLEGRRWRLRQMRANGYGNSIFSSIRKLLVLRYLENERVREPQFDTLRWGMTCGA